MRTILSVSCMIYLTSSLFFLSNLREKYYFQSCESILIVCSSLIIAFLTDKYLKKLPILFLSILNILFFLLFLYTDNFVILLLVSVTLLPQKNLMDAQITKEAGTNEFFITKSVSSVIMGFLIFILGFFDFSLHILIVLFLLLQIVLIVILFQLDVKKTEGSNRVGGKEKNLNIFDEIKTILPYVVIVCVLNLFNQFLKFTPHFFEENHVLMISGMVAFFEGFIFMFLKKITPKKKHLIISFVCYLLFVILLILFYNFKHFVFLVIGCSLASVAFVLYTIFIKSKIQKKSYTTHIFVDVIQTAVLFFALSYLIY